MNFEKIKAFLDMQEDLRNEGIIALDVYNKEFQMRNNCIMQLPNVQFESRGRNEYPWEAFTVVDGIKLFCLLTQKEYEKYTQPFMVEDVQLDGMPEEGGKIV